MVLVLVRHAPSGGKLGALHAAVTMEREVSLPFAPPTPVPTRRPVESAEASALRRDVAAVLEQRVDDIATRWAGDARALLPAAMISTVEDAPSSPDDVHPVEASVLVRGLAAALAAQDGALGEVATHAVALGAAAFAAGVALPQLLLAFNRLVAGCLEVVEQTVDEAGVRIAAGDVARVCRAFQEAAGVASHAMARGHAEAAARALQERFRRLRHDLRNPIGTIRSALSLMADEAVPEEARRSPRFQAMIERNTLSLDQMIVARLSDAEAQQLSASGGRAADSTSTAPGLGEPRDDVARAGERDDRQTRSL